MLIKKKRKRFYVSRWCCCRHGDGADVSLRANLVSALQQCPDLLVVKAELFINSLFLYNLKKKKKRENSGSNL